MWWARGGAGPGREAERAPGPRGEGEPPTIGGATAARPVKLFTPDTAGRSRCSVDLLTPARLQARDRARLHPEPDPRRAESGTWAQPPGEAQRWGAPGPERGHGRGTRYPATSLENTMSRAGSQTQRPLVGLGLRAASTRDGSGDGRERRLRGGGTRRGCGAGVRGGGARRGQRAGSGCSGGTGPPSRHDTRRW